MDIMNSKKTLLSLINGGVTLGAAPTGSSTVKFAYTENIAKVGTAGDGTVTFYADTTNNTGIIAVGDKIVSSKILNITSAAATGNKHGGKTITVSYFNNGAAATTTFDVIDEAGLEAYFTGSKTIDISTGNIYEVKTDNATILVDSTNGLKSGLKLVYVAGTAQTGASIQLQDAANTALNTIPVSNIIGNGVLDHSSYDKQKNELHLFFKTSQPDVYNEVVIPVGEILDINDIFIKNDSSIYLTATADTSVMNLGVLTVDPSLAAADNTGLADAWKVKQYVDSKSQDLAVEAESRDTYLDASVLAANNKKVWVAAQVANLTVAKDGTANTTITGTSGKLVDAADAATKTTSYVNARIAEEIDKLGNTADSSAEFVKVVVTTEDGDVSVVTVTEKVGSLTGTTTAITGESGLIDGAAAATAISTYVEGRLDASIQALDADISTAEDLDAANGIYVRGTLTEVDGVVTTIGLTSQIADTSITRYDKADGINPAWELNEDGLLNGDAATKIKNYVDDVAAKIKDEVSSIDSSKSDADGANFISIHEEQEDGEITVFTVDSSYGAYNYTAGTHTFGTATDGLAKVADTQTFVQTVVESLDLLASASDASAADASNFVKTTISETDGIVKNESVEVTYAAVTAAPGSITVNTNGIVKGDVLKNSIESALTWTVLE